MTDRKDRAEMSDERIEALLAQMADDAPTPSVALMERIVADAQDVAQAREAQTRDRQGARQAGAGRSGVGQAGAGRAGLAGWLANLLAPIGGWPAVAGLATATVAGVWIGYASGDGLTGLTGLNGDAISASGGAELGEFMLSYDDLLGEG